MNWTVRFKNPVFWIQLILTAFATALAYAGLTAQDMT
ncbi:Holin, phage phi LC3, partial [gut metagenome]